MSRILIKLLVACACVSTLMAQDFKFYNHDVQVHGFASQGFVSTNGNNWLTMKTGGDVGSGQFTDFGGNVSIQVTNNFLVGAQVYDRNLGQLGKWHPQLDWAVASYKFKPWLRIRGGKVKTVIGLYNDTQDLDFLHTFALMPQSVYPTDVRDVTLAQRSIDIPDQVRLTTDRHPGRLVMAFFEVQEPIVGHELNPEGGENVEEGRLLILAFGVSRAVPIPIPTAIRLRLDA